EDASRFVSFARTIFHGATCAHLSLGQIEDGGASTALGHLEQSGAAGLLHVVTMRGDGENVEVSGFRHGSQSRIATATPSRSGTIVVYQSFYVESKRFNSTTPLVDWSGSAPSVSCALPAA